MIIKQYKMKKTYLLLPLLILFLFSCKEEKVVKAKKDLSIAVKTQNPVPDTIAIPIKCTGRLSSKTEVKLSFKTGGLISNIFVDEGDEVKAGQILAKLNLSEIQAHVSQAKLALEKAERDHQRAKNLYEDSVATLEQYQNAKTALEYAQTNVQIAEFNMKYSTITAPADGKILKRVAEVNEMIAPGYPVFLFSSGEKNWVIRTGVTDKDVVKINLGDSVNIKFDAYANHYFKGEITEIGSMADPYIGTYEVEVKVNPENYNVMTGFIARTEIIPGKAKAYLTLPVSALAEASGKTAYVYKVKNDTLVEKTKVDFDNISDDRLLITSGISQSDDIVTTGVLFLNEKSIIKVNN